MQQLTTNTLLQGGRYKIIKMLGQGGFGITYLAVQSGLERKVAVKEFFMKELCNRDESTSHVTLGTEGSRETVNRFREKFLKEARNIARLNHPNIVRIIDVFEENGTAYYVMEYAENGSLADKVKRVGYLPEPVATRYIKQVAEALDYIHQRKMNHLDVKPANIMLNEDHNVVLIDFGLAKQYDMATGSQTSTTPVGISEGYAPMEQYKQGGVGEFSPETDIYALGATYFKLLTGMTPPSASDVNEDGVPTDELKAKAVSDKAVAVICKAMEGRKRDRTKTIEAFIASLCNISTTLLKRQTYTDEVTIIDSHPMDDSEQTQIGTNVTESNRCKSFDINGVVFRMIKVEGGTFDMKETVSSEFLGQPSKEIVQRTTLSDYYIGETVVTQALWKTVMGGNLSRFEGENLPVERVSWNDCKIFISKLNSITGQNFRLPTEAEWEFAARGGNNSNHYQYSGSNNINDVAWHCENSDNKTHTVATKQPNELGIYDMSGNVFEWCLDCPDNYSSESQTNPIGSNSELYRVYRGGCWYFGAELCRTSYRGFCAPNVRNHHLGFRLALSE